MRRRDDRLALGKSAAAHLAHLAHLALHGWHAGLGPDESTDGQQPSGISTQPTSPEVPHDEDAYWRIDCPSSDDYRHTLANGEGRHPYGLPGVTCSQCGQTWGGIWTLPYRPPAALAKDRRLRNLSPISEREHVALREEVRRCLEAEGQDVGLLRPIVDFQPLQVAFPRPPSSAFMWPVLGGPVVTDPVRQLLEAAGITGVVFCPVVITKVGRHKADRPVPIPRSGEPEDIIREARPMPNPSTYGPLFEMVVTGETPPPPGVVVRSCCEACGRVEYDLTERRMALTRGMVPGSDVFYLGTTLYVVVSARVRELILAKNLSNVAFSEMPMESA